MQKQCHKLGGVDLVLHLLPMKPPPPLLQGPFEENALLLIYETDGTSEVDADYIIRFISDALADPEESSVQEVVFGQASGLALVNLYPNVDKQGMLSMYALDATFS